MLFLPLNKRNTRDKAKGLRITSEKYIGELGVRCLSRINRGQDSRQQPSIRGASNHYWSVGEPLLVDAVTYIAWRADLYRFVCGRQERRAPTHKNRVEKDRRTSR